LLIKAEYKKIVKLIGIYNEAFFYNLFKSEIPVPQVLVYKKKKKVYNKNFIVYTKVEGDNLYSKWHLMNLETRKNIVKQLCDILRFINNYNPQELIKKFNINTSESWHDKIINNIKESLKQIEEKQLLPEEFLQAIKKFVESNHKVLMQEKIGLVYWDAHFDNILVKDDKISGIIDFERTDLSSIDYNLDIIKRMQEYPTKYVSEEFEKFIKPENYSNLLDWFKDFYPELFDFDDLKTRLDFYELEYNLNSLLSWPKSETVKKMIAKAINYKY